MWRNLAGSRKAQHYCMSLTIRDIHSLNLNHELMEVHTFDLIPLGLRLSSVAFPIRALQNIQNIPEYVGCQNLDVRGSFELRFPDSSSLADLKRLSRFLRCLQFIGLLSKMAADANHKKAITPKGRRKVSLNLGIATARPYAKAEIYARRLQHLIKVSPLQGKSSPVRNFVHLRSCAWTRCASDSRTGRDRAPEQNCRRC